MQTCRSRSSLVEIDAGSRPVRGKSCAIAGLLCVSPIGWHLAAAAVHQRRPPTGRWMLGPGCRKGNGSWGRSWFLYMIFLFFTEFWRMGFGPSAPDYWYTICILFGGLPLSTGGPSSAGPSGDCLDRHRPRIPTRVGRARAERGPPPVVPAAGRRLDHEFEAICIDVRTRGGCDWRCGLLSGYVPLGTLSLIYLMAVLFSARHFGLWPALLGVLLSVNAYNYFFIPPRFTFRIDDPADIATLIVFSIVSLVVSNLTAESRRQMQSIAEHARLTEEHYAFSRKLIGIGTVDALLAVVSERIDAMFRCEVAILLPSADGLAVRSIQPSDQTIDATDVTLARRCQGSGEACRRERESAGEGLEALPSAALDRRSCRGRHRRPHNARPSGRRRARLAGRRDRPGCRRDRAHRPGGKHRGSAPDRRGEKLRNAVLTAISHDLRTPLSGNHRCADKSRAPRRDRGRADAAGNHVGRPRRIGTARSVRRQHARHGQAGSRRCAGAGRADRSRRCGQRSDRPCRIDVANPKPDHRPAGRPAARAGRPGTLRAGGVRSARQCRKAFTARGTDHDHRRPGGQVRPAPGRRRGSRPRLRSGQRSRPGPPARPRARTDRPRPVDLPGLPAGDGRRDRCGEP